MTVRIRGLVRTAAGNGANDPQLAYLETLTPRRREQFVTALTGDTAPSSGCLSRVSPAVQQLGLPSDGRLAGAFGEAIGDLHQSDGYREFSRSVISCIRQHGIHVDSDDDLVLVQRPLLLRSLQMTGAEYTIKGGRIHFSMQASKVTPEVLAQLPAFRAEEMRVANVEATCRAKYAVQMHELLVTYTGPLVERYSNDVAVLREALHDYKQ